MIQGRPFLWLFLSRIFGAALTLAAGVSRVLVAFVVAGALAARHYGTIVFGLPLTILLGRQYTFQLGSIDRIGLIKLRLALIHRERGVVACSVKGFGALVIQIVNGASLHVGQCERFGHLVGFALDHHMVMVGALFGIVVVGRDRADRERCRRNQQKSKGRCHKAFF